MNMPHKKLSLIIFLLLLAGIICNETGVNLWLSSLVADGNNGFPLRGHWLTERVLHYYAGKFTGILALGLILFCLKQWLWPRASYHTIISSRYLMFSWLSSALAIGILKKVTKLPCPWSLKVFGGTNDYVGILDVFSKQFPAGYCFPSGHASGGYGLLGLAFIAFAYGFSMRSALTLPVFLGALYGGAQISRGAHFISHDFFTVAICLISAWFWAVKYLSPRWQTTAIASTVTSLHRQPFQD